MPCPDLARAAASLFRQKNPPALCGLRCLPPQAAPPNPPANPPLACGAVVRSLRSLKVGGASLGGPSASASVRCFARVGAMGAGPPLSRALRPHCGLVVGVGVLGVAAFFGCAPFGRGCGAGGHHAAPAPCGALRASLSKDGDQARNGGGGRFAVSGGGLPPLGFSGRLFPSACGLRAARPRMSAARAPRPCFAPPGPPFFYRGENPPDGPPSWGVRPAAPPRPPGFRSMRTALSSRSPVGGDRGDRSPRRGNGGPAPAYKIWGCPVGHPHILYTWEALIYHHICVILSARGDIHGNRRIKSD